MFCVISYHVTTVSFSRYSLTCGRHDSASALKTNDNRSATHQISMRDVPLFFGYEINGRPRTFRINQQLPKRKLSDSLNNSGTYHSRHNHMYFAAVSLLQVSARSQISSCNFTACKRLLHMKCQLPTNYGNPDWSSSTCIL